MISVSDELYLGTAKPESGGGGGEINNQDITITSNGTYTAEAGYTGIGTATVSLPLGSKTITANDTYLASSDNLEGFSSVIVNVPNPSTGTINITSNGTYNVTQYASAEVNCPSADIVTAMNNTGSAIASGDKVWLENASGGWNLQKQDLRYFQVTGSVSLDDTTKIASNFSTSNFISLPFNPYNFAPSSSAWEIMCKYKTSSTATDAGNVEYVYGCPDAQKSVLLGYYQGEIQLWLASSNSSWNILNGENIGYYIQANTVYWFKVEFTGTEYNGYYSTDKQNWTRFAHVVSSTPINEAKFYLGNAYNLPMKSGSYIDLGETYIKVGGNYWWAPYVSVVEGLFSGFANEAIANGASGDVSVGIVYSKFGLGLDNFFGDVNSSGVLQTPSIITGNITFAGVTDIAGNGLRYRFAGNANSFSLSFPNLTQLSSSSAMYNIASSSSITSVNMQNLETVSGISALSYAFSGCGILTSVDFSKLKTISGFSGCSNMLSSSSSLTEVHLDSLETISGNNGAQSICSGLSNATSITFNGLKYIRGSSGFSSAVLGCSKLTTFSLPELVEVSSTGGLSSFCNGCLLLETVYFSKLSDISASTVFSVAFATCRALTDIYFNALTTSSFGSNINQFSGMFNSSTASNSGAFTMHFPSNLESTIQGLTGYPNFGATAGRLTLAFDLPATS